MELKTAPEYIELMRNYGFSFWRACNCHGTYWEKFRNADRQVIRVAVYKGTFIFRASTGTLAELENALILNNVATT